MPRREEIVAERMADAIVKRLTTRKVVEIKDEAGGRGGVRQVLVDNIPAGEKLQADPRQPLPEHAKKIKESAPADPPRLGKGKGKMSRAPGVHPSCGRAP